MKFNGVGFNSHGGGLAVVGYRKGGRRWLVVSTLKEKEEATLVLLDRKSVV